MSLTTGFGLCRLCVIAGNISPIDVITHVPILCEEANIPYIYVPSKEVCCIFFLPHVGSMHCQSPSSIIISLLHQIL